ncbi:MULTISPECIES: hypothetical protein [unclassified Azospirillum]|uniref:hypothetical protein n=1 Tax=unclassified Azospirillum TaxID=2630922 RepID=UPI000B720EBA|nr:MULTISPECIES: hypothetical protein [unclassified Azospirillum]SNS88292.1 hypothetical protein SAMN05880556_11460 [Azospirillum sp. RU38E]SNT05308.1 hypothetical protein SAMN05880591_11460 [Azospirillum sp. RU37A]
MADESRLNLILCDEGYDAAAGEESISKLARIFGVMLAREHIEAASRAMAAAAEAVNGLPVDAIRAGIGRAVSDLRFVPMVGHRDTRPTEEQVKFALYRSLSEDEWTVQAGVSPAGIDARCDMLAVRRDDRIAVGGKIAWAGNEATCRPAQQVRDLGKEHRRAGGHAGCRRRHARPLRAGIHALAGIKGGRRPQEARGRPARQPRLPSVVSSAAGMARREPGRFLRASDFLARWFQIEGQTRTSSGYSAIDCACYRIDMIG